MASTNISYMGIQLKSPYIASSSGITNNIDYLVALEKAGAGAVVLKSLFEEQIDNHAQYLAQQSVQHSENSDLIHAYLKEHTLGEYTKKIKEAKEALTIPVIASINCFNSGNWENFAREIERAGADALELNIYSLPLSRNMDSTSVENEIIRIVKDITAIIKIPVAVKLSDNYTTLPRFVESCSIAGAKAVVLFNKFYTPDIDLKNLSLVSSNPITQCSSYHNSLRWIAIISSMVQGLDYSASTGVLNPDDGIKMLLAGAETVQLCSVLYKEGISSIERFNSRLVAFMEENGFDNLKEVVGKLNYGNILPPDTPEKYERFQFVKTHWE